MPLNVIREESNALIEHGPTARYGARVNWGAIFGGAFVTLGLASMFFLLGNAVGLRALNITSPAAGSGIKAGTFIYDFCTIVFSFAFGSYVTGKVGQLDSRMSGTMHGLVVWALAGVSALVLGLMFSVRVLATVAGVGLDVANWLVWGIAFGSFIAAGLGGMIGARKSADRAKRTSLEQEQIERRVA